MDITESKFFTKTDLKVLRALGFGKVEVFPDHSYEEIDLGGNTYLVGEHTDLFSKVYFVTDRECHECYSLATSALMAIANYKEGKMVNNSDAPVPDYFWPWELRWIAAKYPEKNVHVRRFQKFYYSPGYAVVISGDRNRVKLARNPYSEWDIEMFRVELPETLPDFDQWETMVDKEGKELVADCSGVFSLKTAEEQCRALNILIKDFYNRIKK